MHVEKKFVLQTFLVVVLLASFHVRHGLDPQEGSPGCVPIEDQTARHTQSQRQGVQLQQALVAAAA
jgi:hypothetical protein